jgi:hypothetical protein
MENLTALLLVVLGTCLGVMITVVYNAWHDAWMDEEAMKRILEGRVNVLERDSSKLEGFRKHHVWRIELIEERLKKLEPTEEA